MTLKLSLDHKRHKKWYEQSPRKDKPHGRPKKAKLRGAAAKYAAAREAGAAVNAVRQHTRSQDNSTAHDVVTPNTKQRKRKQSVRMTRSMKPCRSTRESMIIDKLDPTPCSIYSYGILGAATRKAKAAAKEDKMRDAYSLKMKRITVACFKYRTLYLSNLDHNVNEERFESSIVLAPPRRPRATTANDLKQLANYCKEGREQIVSQDVISQLGFDDIGNGKLSNVAKQEKVIAGVRAILNYHFPALSDAQHACILGKKLTEGQVFGVAAGKEVASTISRTFTRNVFRPWRILKQLDCNCQGSLNDSAVGDYANIEKDVMFAPFKRGQSLLSGRNAIGLCRKSLNKIAEPVFGIQHNRNPNKSQHGDHVQVNYEKMTRFLVEGFGLTNKAMTAGIELSFTADGAQMIGAKSASQTASGIKMMDLDAIDPDDSKLMFVDEIDANNKVLTLKNHQADRACALTEIVLHSETKAIMRDVFGDFWKFAMDLGQYGLPASDLGPAFMPAKTTATGDMSLLMKITGRGGACKVKYFFCMCCECHFDEDMFSFVAGDDVCDICVHNKRTKCRHRKLNDAVEIRRKSLELLDFLVSDCKRRQGAELNLRDFLPDGEVPCFVGYNTSQEPVYQDVNLKDTISNDDEVTRPLADYISHLTHSEEEREVLEHSKMIYCPELLDTNNVFNVEYNPPQGSMDENTSNRMVLNDLRLRGYTTRELMGGYTAQERRCLLKKALQDGRRIRMYRHALQIEVEAMKTQVVPVGKAIPCILHAKNRTAEKFLQQILTHGLHSLPTKAERQSFIARVETTINVEVMGKAAFNEIGQWRIPMENDKLGDIKLSCPDANKIVDAIDVVVRSCTEHLPQHRQEEWLSCAMAYSLTMEKLKSRQLFTFEDVCDFQDTADEFAESYIYLTGIDGMTNYFHFIVAGHFSYYLLKFENLYKYSQQGWERVNGKAKRTYNHATQKGGGKGGSSKLLPIVYTFLRELLWRFGHGDELFKKHDDEELTYGKIQKQHIADDKEIDLLVRTILNLGSEEDIFGMVDEFLEAAV